MSDEPRQHTGDDEPWALEPAGADSPRPAPDPADKPKPRLEAQPILELEEEHCPTCRAPLGPGDVVCLKCGYDMRANAVRQVEHRTESVDKDAEGDEGPEPFVTPGRGSPKALLIAGAVVAVAAMVAAGMGVPPGNRTSVVIVAVLLVLYEVLVHTGTGLVAVATAAKISEERFGGEEAVALAAARVFVAMAVFELVLNAVTPLGWFARLVAWPLAGAAYWLVVWLLFNKTKTVALVIVLAQVILWVLVRMGMALAAWYSTALQP